MIAPRNLKTVGARFTEIIRGIICRALGHSKKSEMQQTPSLRPEGYYVGERSISDYYTMRALIDQNTRLIERLRLADIALEAVCCGEKMQCAKCGKNLPCCCELTIS